MYKELTNNEIFELFNFQTFKIFELASEICQSKALPSIEHIFLSLIYIKPEIFNNSGQKELINKLTSDLKKIIQSFSDYNIQSKERLETVLNQAKYIAKLKEKLISPEILFISILEDNESRIILENRIGDITGFIKDFLEACDINPDIIPVLNFLEPAHQFNLKGKADTINKILENLGTYLSTHLLITGTDGVGKSSLANLLPEILKTSNVISNVIKQAKFFNIKSIENYLSFQKLESLDIIDDKCIIIIDLKNNNFISLYLIIQGLYVSKNVIKIVLFTSPEVYQVLNDKYSDLLKNFSIIALQEPDQKDLLAIIKDASVELERFHNVIIQDKILNSLIENCLKYKTSQAFPAYALKVLDSSCSHARIKNLKFLEEKHILYAIKCLV